MQSKKESLSILERVLTIVAWTVFSYFWSQFDYAYSSVALGSNVLIWILMVIDWVYLKPIDSFARKIFPKLTLVIIFGIFLLFGWLILTFVPIETQENFQALLFFIAILVCAFSYIAYLLLHKIDFDLRKGKGNKKLAKAFSEELKTEP